MKPESRKALELFEAETERLYPSKERTRSTDLAACCQAVVTRYRQARGSEAEGAALFCPTCTSRVVLRDGTWRRAS